MIIRDSNINLAARHHYQERLEVSEQLLSRAEAPAESAPAIQPQQASRTVTLSASAPQPIDLSSTLSAEDRMQIAIIAQLFQQITGRELQLAEPAPELSTDGPVMPLIELPANLPGDINTLVYERHSRYEETEKLQFSAQGQATTQDGRNIDFSASLRMSRHYVEETTESLVMGNAVMTDPLVINFDGTGAELSRTHFAFDLDNDGTPEQIANLKPNSGYLALDRNGDGKINNGSELFGPQSNNGFAELAEFDEDGNGFIDEGDAIYDQLRIWQRNDSGESRLLALGDKDIGAIYLGHTQTPFQLKDADNNSLGEVVSSGVFLREDGSSGVVQQINLAV